RIGAIAIHQQSRIRAERLADQRHDLVGAAGPLVLVMAAFLSDAELERGVAVLVPELDEAGGFVLGRDLAAFHAAGIDRKGPGLAAEQLTDALAGALAAQVPERGIEPAERAHEVGARKLVLPLRNGVGQGCDVVGIGTQRPARDLTVKDLAGYVGIV